MVDNLYAISEADSQRRIPDDISVSVYDCTDYHLIWGSEDTVTQMVCYGGYDGRLERHAESYAMPPPGEDGDISADYLVYNE